MSCEHLIIFHSVHVNCWSKLHRLGCFQVLGLIRCPVYTMHDKQGGLPSFLRNNFVGNSRQQLLIGLEHAGILTQEEIKEVVHFSKLIQASTPKLWRLWYGKCRYVELISSAVDNVSILGTNGRDGKNPEAVWNNTGAWLMVTYCWNLEVSVKCLGVFAKSWVFLCWALIRREKWKNVDYVTNDELIVNSVF